MHVWVGTTKGWFNVYFYPQDSSTGSQSSGYLYSSFKKTGKLWWGPFQGGDGAVYASIDGSGSSYPIAECDNASRVIKYVVIMGYRYSSYKLVGMRIHDIAVVADLTRTNPTAPNPDEPVVFDGTADGIVEHAESNPGVQELINTCVSLWNQVITWWEGWWPRLHMSVSFSTPAGGTVVLHISVDILFALRFEDFSISTPVDDQMTDEQQQAWALSVVQATQADGALEDSLRGATAFMAWTFAGICAALALPGLTAAAYVQTIVAALSLWSIWLASVLSVYQMGLVSIDFLCGLVGMWLHTLFGKAVITLTFAVWMSYLLTKYDKLSETEVLGWKWLAARLIWSIISIAFQFLVAVATLYLFASLAETSMQNYLEVAQ